MENTRMIHRRKKMILPWIQLVISALLMMILGLIDILPLNYMMIIGIVLWIFFFFSWALYRGRRSRAGGRLLSLLLILVLSVGSFYLMETYSVLKKVTDSEVPGSGVDTTEEFFTVYISGNDMFGELEEDSRSDVNIIAAVNPKTHQVLLLSTPRDYYVPLAMNGEYDKLTHAGIYGVEESMRTLENLYGISLDYHVRLNFTGFTSIIDAIGGVTVEVEESFTSVNDIYFEKGTHTLNGKEALAFARERKAFADGDVQRGRNQMKIIKAVVDRMMSPSMLLNYTSVLDAAEGCFETSMSADAIADLVKMQIQKGGDWNIVSYNVDGYSESRWTYSYAGQPLSVMIPDMETVQQAQYLIGQVRNGEILQ